MAKKLNSRVIRIETALNKLTKAQKDIFENLGLKLVTACITIEGNCPKCSTESVTKVEYVTFTPIVLDDTITSVCSQCISKMRFKIRAE